MKMHHSHLMHFFIFAGKSIFRQVSKAKAHFNYKPKISRGYPQEIFRFIRLFSFFSFDSVKYLAHIRMQLLKRSKNRIYLFSASEHHYDIVAEICACRLIGTHTYPLIQVSSVYHLMHERSAETPSFIFTMVSS